MKFSAALILTLIAFTSVLRGESTIHVRNGLITFPQKLAAGEPIHIAFLGGSITQNANGHVKMVPDAIRKLHPTAKLNITNAGLSSTCSTSGAFRWRDHILAKGPIDLLVVEFAVNDDQDAAHARRECIRGMEGIIRGVLEQSRDTDILMVHFTNKGMLDQAIAGETPLTVEAHEAVAGHYSVASVNVVQALANTSKAGGMDWTEYGGTHPKAAGYRMASDLVMHVLTKEIESPVKKGERAPLPEPLDPANYSKGTFIDPKAAEVKGDWARGNPSREVLGKGGFREDYATWPLLRSSKAGDSLRLSFTGNTIGAFILAGPDAGSVETRIDGGEWTTTTLFHRYSKGLHYPRSVIFGAGLGAGDHLLELRITPGADPSNGTTASILQFLGEAQ